MAEYGVEEMYKQKGWRMLVLKLGNVLIFWHSVQKADGWIMDRGMADSKCIPSAQQKMH